jgi:hypothetical protein
MKSRIQEIKGIIHIILFVVPCIVHGQDQKEAPKYGIVFSGFVKTDIFFDSRQTVNIREGHFLLYPENISLDANNRDINAKSNFNILSIQSRLKGTITGPEAFGAKTSGVLEADFFGNENSSFSDLNGFRLRHAYLKLTWKKSELLVGQYWHPMLIAESFPGVVSFNTGAPFQPFSRNPQIRLTKSSGNLKLIGVLFSQRDFTSTGPQYTFSGNKYTQSVVASSKYTRNSSIPNVHLQLQFTPDSTENLFGAGIDYKTIMPDLYTVNNARSKKFTSSETLESFSAIAFARFKLSPITVRLEAVYAQNGYDLVMTGGYAVSNVIDTATGARHFTNLNTASVWIDATTNGKKIQGGLFAGYSENLGSSDIIETSDIFARGADIKSLYRIAPRIIFISGKSEIALEAEYTSAAYGKFNSNTKGNITDIKNAENTRLLLAFIYRF